MSRQEHRVKMLNSIYDRLGGASKDTYGHKELEELREEIEALRNKVSNMLSKEDLSNMSDNK